MLLSLFSMGMHSTFFGPIKYAILPQHLGDDEVLSGTGWVEAGTYIAILGGTIAGGLIAPDHAIIGIVAVAIIGRLTANYVRSEQRRVGKACASTGRSRGWPDQ